MINYLDDLNYVGELLLNDKVILGPTDTVWGLACNAFSEPAVNKIYTIKNRQPGKPFILLVNSIEQLKKYIQDIHPRIETLIHYHQRPLSVIYQANINLPQYLLEPNRSIAIRVTKDPILVELIEILGLPLVSTSANLEGKMTPNIFDEVEQVIRDGVDYIFKTKRNSKKKKPPSMLIKFDQEGELIFLRK